MNGVESLFRDEKNQVKDKFDIMNAEFTGRLPLELKESSMVMAPSN